MAGSNGAGNSTFVEHVLIPQTGLPFVNADVIAADRWPDDQAAHAYDASAAAAEERHRLLDRRASFITETVFSHPSKVDLVRGAVARGYTVYLHVILVPEDTTVGRVDHRVRHGGHAVPEGKIRERYARLWPLVNEARSVADLTTVYDNSRADRPFRVVAHFERGSLVGKAAWPPWTALALISQTPPPAR